MVKYHYFVGCKLSKDKETCFWVTFPHIFACCISKGDTSESAFENACDALELLFDYHFVSNFPYYNCNKKWRKNRTSYDANYLVEYCTRRKESSAMRILYPN